jgi:hypothetical protein
MPRVLGRIFGYTKEEITGDLRKLLNEELHTSHSSPNINMITSKNNVIGGACSTNGKEEICAVCNILIGKPEGKR